MIIPEDDICNNKILFNIKGFKNYSEQKIFKKKIELEKFPVSYNEYKKKFDAVLQELVKGNSYLVNLTCRTQINLNLSLEEIFFISKAKYKLYYNDEFVVFSPEQFIIIENNIISGYPMKGTINAAEPDAEEIILADEKEFAEHITIVDLIRNDLGMISKKVEVEKFRYIDRIKTVSSELLQVSSKITGVLEDNWQRRFGDILFSILPAGSVTGAPKKKTVEIIRDVENYDRGFYTGVFGYFDGENVDSGVMIRFIEKVNGGLFYKSGGGITVYSDPEKEYNEMLDKIYVPVD